MPVWVMILFAVLGLLIGGIFISWLNSTGKREDN